MAYEILPASIHHLEELVSVFDAYRTFYAQPSDPNGAAAFLKKRLTREESKIYLAYSQELKQILGFVQLYPSFSSVSMQRLWILNDLFVQPDYRRNGIGKALMQKAQELAEQSGAKGLVLETGIENRSAQALYEQLGYKRSNDYYVYQLSL